MRHQPPVIAQRLDQRRMLRGLGRHFLVQAAAQQDAGGADEESGKERHAPAPVVERLG